MSFNMFISATATKGARPFLVERANIIWLVITVMGEFTVISFEASSMQEEFARDPPRHARRGGSSCTVDDFGDTKATRGTRLRRRGDARRTPRVWSVGAARSFVRSLSSSSRFRRSALWWAPKRGIGFPKNGRDAE